MGFLLPQSKDDFMVTQLLEKKMMRHLFQATTHLIKLPQTRMWLDYDPEADVLYLFEEHPSSTHSEMRDDGVILDYDQNERLVGMTVLDASLR